MAEMSLAAAAPIAFFRERLQQHLQEVSESICAEHDAIVEELQKTFGAASPGTPSSHSEDARDRNELRRKRLVRLKVASQEGYVAPGGAPSGAGAASSALVSRLSNGQHGGKLASAGDAPRQEATQAPLAPGGGGSERGLAHRRAMCCI